MNLRTPEQVKSHAKVHAVFRVFEKALPAEAPLIVDAGASFGVFAYMARHRWGDGRILCIEPNEAHHEQLKKNSLAPILSAALLPKPAPRTVPMKFAGIKGTATPTLTKWAVTDGPEVSVSVIDPSLLPRRISFLRLNVAGAEVHLIPQLPPCDYIWVQVHNPSTTKMDAPKGYEIVRRHDRHHLLKRTTSG